MQREPSFEFEMDHERATGETLLVGLPHVGMASLTAVDYLVRNLETEELGHVSPADLPAIAPFEDGVPRHHTRLYNIVDADVTVLLGELFVPVWAAESFADALMRWVDAAEITEIAMLHGIPFPHDEEGHRVFHVATPDFREERLDDAVPPLQGGLLDGVVGDLVTRNLEASAPPVGVFVTPTHPPGPDIDAALLFLETITEVYDLTVDLEELEDLSARYKQYYAEMSERMESLQEANLANRDYPDDRMYM